MIVKKIDEYRLQLTLAWRRSRAICSPTAFMSFLERALVMYKCRSRNRSMKLPNSACSISNCESKCTNHSKLRWSRLIQKKSTYWRKKKVKWFALYKSFIFNKVRFFFSILRINYLFKVHNSFGHIISCPTVMTLRTTVLTCVITVHYGLEDTGERSYTNTSSNQNCVTRVENVTRWSTVRSVNSDLSQKRENIEPLASTLIKISLFTSRGSWTVKELIGFVWIERAGQLLVFC